MQHAGDRRLLALILVAGVTTLACSESVAFQAGDEFQDCDTCPRMVVVPAGSFTMGSPESETGRHDHEGPQRLVRIPHQIAVGKFELTRDQFETFVRETGHEAADRCWIHQSHVWRAHSVHPFRAPGISGGGSHPVVCVDWSDANAYVTWLARKTGKPYRLPSEAEWEYAARAGTSTRFHFGNDKYDLCDFANIADESSLLSWGLQRCWDHTGAMTATVGRYRPNAFGLHDMHGNVWEWVADCYRESYRGAPTDGSARTSDDCGQRVLRGASWGDPPPLVRSASRILAWEDFRADMYGFRVARPLTPEELR